MRCLDYLGLANSTEALYGLAGSSPNGSCAAMIWSGHTAGTILGIYYTLIALDLECLRPGLFLGRGPSRMVGVVMFGAVGETALLLGNNAHYSIDCYLSMIIVPLLISHPRFSRWARWINPFIPRLSEEDRAAESARIASVVGCAEDRMLKRKMQTERRLQFQIRRTSMRESGEEDSTRAGLDQVSAMPVVAEVRSAENV